MSDIQLCDKMCNKGAEREGGHSCPPGGLENPPAVMGDE